MHTITDLARIIWVRRSIPRLVGAACLFAGSAGVAVAFPAGPAGPAVAHVSDARAVAYSRVVTVTTLSDSGAGSLRAAVEQADATAARDSTVIRFGVRGTVALRAALPVIARRVTIDATSAPGHVTGGPPVVALDFGGYPGLLFGAGSAGSQLLGLAVDGASGNGVTLDAGQVTLNADYIGLDLTGAAAPNGGSGVYAAAASKGNVIGLNASRASGAVANVISGNRGSGIVLAGSSGNTVADNRIGTNAAGTAAIANQADGIRVTAGATGNEIGGTVFTDGATGRVNDPTGDKGKVTPVFVVPPLGNLISGNGGNGVTLTSGTTGGSVLDNYIGLGQGGQSLPNTGSPVVNGGYRNTISGNVTGTAWVPVTG